MVSAKRVWFVLIFYGCIVTPIVFLSTMLFLINQEYFGKMPTFEELENPKSNIATEVFSEDKKLIGTFHIENRSFVTFEELSPNLVKALIATEDIRFAEHSGIDMIGLARVAVRTIAMGDKTQGGGSTITQQLAKNLFPRENYRNENSFQKYSRLFIIKLKEWITAVKLERNYTKNEILAMYLNIVPFGSNAFGIRSAATTFFNKHPSQLLIEEAALLAGIVNAPTRYSPVRNIENATNRRNFVMKQMVRANYLPESICQELSKRPIALKYKQQDHNTGLATYFRERVRQTLSAKKPERKRYTTKEDFFADSIEWLQNPAYGWCNKNLKPDGTPYDINRDGLKIYTTVNSKMQQYAEDALIEHLKYTLQPALNHEIKTKGGRIFGSSINKEQEEELIIRAIKQTERYRLLNKEGWSIDRIIDNFNKAITMTIFTWDKGEL
ncbi:MAG: transglycosylase domain-containing protein, partial [Phocaeicola sp.]